MATIVGFCLAMDLNIGVVIHCDVPISVKYFIQQKKFKV